MSAVPRVRHLAGETAVYGIAGTLNRFIGVFLVPLYVRAFTSEEYAGLALMTSLLGLCTTFSVLGLDNASARWFFDTADPARRRGVMATWLWCQLALGIAIALIASALAAPLARAVFGSPEQAAIVALAGWTVPLWAFAKVLGNWLRYQRRAWTTTAFFAINSLLTIALVIWLVAGRRLGLHGLFSAQVLAGALTGVVAIGLARSWLAPRHVSPRLLAEMLRFGLPLVPAAVASWVTASSDRFIVQWYHGREQVALYAAAIAVASIVALPIGAFQMSWGPFAFSILGQDGARNVYARALSAYAFFGVWLATVVSLFAPMVLAVFTTPVYAGATTAVPYLALGQVALGATYIAALGPSVVKRSSPVAVSIFVGATVNLALNLALVPPLGMMGAAMATCLAYTAAAAYLFAVSQRLYALPYRFRDAVLPVALGSVVLLAARWAVPATTPGAVIARAALALTFVPLGTALGLLRRRDAIAALAALHRRLSAAQAR